MRPILTLLAALALAVPASAEEKKPKVYSPAFEAVPLADVLEWLNKEAGFEYTLTKEAQKIALKGLVEVTLVGKDLTAHEALGQVLDSIGLAYAEKVAGQVRIMTADEYAKDIVLELYDVRGLLAEVTDFEGPEAVGWGSSANGKSGRDPRGVHFEEPEEGEKKQDKTPVEDPEKLPELIKAGTGGEKAWVEGTSILLKNGILYVRAPQKVQADVREMLRKMQAFK